MKISKELIEKYHDGLCTPEEKKAVKAWLFDDPFTPETTLPLPVGEDKAKLRDAMWAEISTVLPSRKRARTGVFFKPVWQQVAALLLIVLAGLTAFYLKNREDDRGVIFVNNTSATANQNLHESAFSISVGPKSNVAIHPETGQIDFCGAMLINPNHDIELSIQGTCARPDEKRAKMILKKGQNYIALNYDNAAKANEVIILPQGSLTGLPPLMQRQLMMQFDI